MARLVEGNAPTEPSEPDGAVGLDQQVGGTEIAMEDATLMGMCNSGSGADGDVEESLNRHGVAGRGRGIPANDVFKDEDGPVLSGDERQWRNAPGWFKSCGKAVTGFEFTTYARGLPPCGLDQPVGPAHGIAHAVSRAIALSTQKRRMNPFEEILIEIFEQIC
jgi:hypothetical protein